MPKKGYRQTQEHKGKTARKPSKKTKVCGGCGEEEKTFFKMEVCRACKNKEYSMAWRVKNPKTPKIKSKTRKPSSESARLNLSLSHKGIPWSEKRREAQKNVVRKASSRDNRGENVSSREKTCTIKKNGREYSPYWHDLRKIVYKRDGYICRECGQHCHNKLKIACHHIDYDINNNNLDNLITLCAKCHAKTNYRRVDWINHFNILSAG